MQKNTSIEVTPNLNEPDNLTADNLSDFALFLSVMREKEAYQSVLSIILDDESLEIIEVKVKNVILNKSGKRAIRLDAWAIDAQNRQYAMEMQNESDSDFIPKRARFYQSLLDSPILKAGKETKYRQLPTTAIIFITKDDIFGKDLAKYTFLERCEEVDDLYLEDGTQKIFLNMTSLNGRDELISLLQYMKSSTLANPQVIVHDKRIEVLDNIVREVKKSEEWEEQCMNIWERGMKKSKVDDIFSFLSDIGVITDDISERILGENDLTQLSKWLKLAAKSESVDDFRAHM